MHCGGARSGRFGDVLHAELVSTSKMIDRRYNECSERRRVKGSPNIDVQCHAKIACGNETASGYSMKAHLGGAIYSVCLRNHAVRGRKRASDE